MFRPASYFKKDPKTREALDYKKDPKKREDFEAAYENFDDSKYNKGTLNIKSLTEMNSNIHVFFNSNYTLKE